MIYDNAENENRLRREIEADCSRVRKLDTLSESDRNGKYRNAIAELFERLRKNGTELLAIAVYGRFTAPIHDKAFREGFYDGWLYTKDFAEMRENARNALNHGDFDCFLQVCAQMRKISSAIVSAYGGKEDPE